MNFNNFTGYVLAGGKSSRMATDKAFLRFGDETFLNRAVKSLSTVCENRIVIVLNQTQTHFIEKLPREIPYIFDVFNNRGALGGIHAALQNCRTKYAVILAVDLPFVTGEAIENLAKIAIQSKDCAAFVPIQTDERMQAALRSL
jgi:molybdopterin-guanine dinucleotide biosynthesis protein A